MVTKPCRECQKVLVTNGELCDGCCKKNTSLGAKSTVNMIKSTKHNSKYMSKIKKLFENKKERMNRS